MAARCATTLGMSDGNEESNKAQITGSKLAGVGAGFQMAEIMQQWMRTSVDMQMKWLDLISGQMIINMRAVLRFIDPTISSNSQQTHFVLDLTDKRQFEAVSDFINAMPEPMRSIMRNGTPTEEDILRWRKNPAALYALRLFYQNKLFFPQVGELAKEPYKNQILVEHADGAITPIDPLRIVSLFQATPLNGMIKPTRYPHVIVTSSHARGDSLRDVTNITHGIEAMAQGAWGTPLKLVDFARNPNRTTVIKPHSPDDTLILYMCDSNDNFNLNGIELQERLNERDAVLESGARDPFDKVSRGTKRTAKLLLASLCEDYYGDDGKPKFDINDARPIAQILKDGTTELHLSDDARRILARWKGMGYSKGGETIKSALSYLREELLAPNDRDRGIVRPSHNWPEDRGLRNLGDYGVRSLLSKTMALVIASPARSFSEDEKNDGLRAESYVNQHDGLLRNDHMKSSWNDEFHAMNGLVDDPHNPVLAMGSRTQKGWLVEDPHFKRYLQEYFASNYAKAAIANIYVEAKTDELKIEAAAGTPDDVMFDYAEHITKTLQAHGIKNPKLTLDPHHIGVMTLTADQDLLRDPDAVVKLGRAFDALRDEPDSGLVIATSIRDVNIPHLVHKAHGRLAQEKPAAKVGDVKAVGRTAVASVDKSAPGKAA